MHLAISVNVLETATNPEGSIHTAKAVVELLQSLQADLDLVVPRRD